MKSSPIDKEFSIYRIGALGGLLAALMFVGIAIIHLPYKFEDLGETILLRRQTLTPIDFEHYLSLMPPYFVIDDLLILGWLLAWVALAAYVRERQPLLGNLALVIGVFGPLGDFLENGFAWVLMDAYRDIQVAVPAGWLLAWQLARFVSFVMPYAGAILTAGPLWSEKPLDRLLALWSSVLMVVALASLYYPAVALAGYVWWFGWFLLMAVVLWRRSFN
jgi:hypothetical protein